MQCSCCTARPWGILRGESRKDSSAARSRWSGFLQTGLLTGGPGLWSFSGRPVTMAETNGDALQAKQQEEGGLFVPAQVERVVFKAPAPRTSLLGEVQASTACSVIGCGPSHAVYFLTDPLSTLCMQAWTSLLHRSVTRRRSEKVGNWAGTGLRQLHFQLHTALLKHYDRHFCEMSSF